MQALDSLGVEKGYHLASSVKASRLVWMARRAAASISRRVAVCSSGRGFPRSGLVLPLLSRAIVPVTS